MKRKINTIKSKCASIKLIPDDWIPYLFPKMKFNYAVILYTAIDAAYDEKFDRFLWYMIMRLNSNIKNYIREATLIEENDRTFINTNIKTKSETSDSIIFKKIDIEIFPLDRWYPLETVDKVRYALDVSDCHSINEKTIEKMGEFIYIITRNEPEINKKRIINYFNANVKNITGHIKFTVK